VYDLHQQATACGIAFEIVCIDDCSEESFRVLHREFSNHPNIKYSELPQNSGRSIIRNKLARTATYDWLLFMDCDSQTESPNYIRNYLEAAKEHEVVFGGRSYSAYPPEETSRYFRWKYGSAREVVPYTRRQVHPYRSFMTNNFLIRKDIFLRITMDESIKGYGHEDTLFAQELKAGNVPIGHIDNPLRHIGLETAEVFLKQTQNGVMNLLLLIRKGKIDKDNKLFSAFVFLKTFRLNKIFLKYFLKRKSNWEKQLLSKNPSLRKFDFYKLGLLTEYEVNLEKEKIS
jgi:glycosyltransferase involved in cell wall biosynthesis